MHMFKWILDRQSSQQSLVLERPITVCACFQKKNFELRNIWSNTHKKKKKTPFHVFSLLSHAMTFQSVAKHSLCLPKMHLKISSERVNMHNITWRSQGTLTFTNVPWLRMENGVVQNEKRKEKLLNLEKEGMELYLF